MYDDDKLIIILLLVTLMIMIMMRYRYIKITIIAIIASYPLILKNFKILDKHILI